VVFGFRAFNHSKNHPTVGHQGFIIQFIELIVPTHFKCGIGLEGTVELFGLIPSSRPNVAHLECKMKVSLLLPTQLEVVTALAFNRQFCIKNYD
jgi:hypothetical protein